MRTWPRPADLLAKQLLGIATDENLSEAVRRNAIKDALDRSAFRRRQRLRSKSARSNRSKRSSSDGRFGWRRALGWRGIPHTIPERSDQIARRKAKGSHSGRPQGFDPGTYKRRNRLPCVDGSRKQAFDAFANDAFANICRNLAH